MLTFLRKKMKVVMITVAVVFVASMFYGLGQVGGNLSGGGKSSSKVIAKINGRDLDIFRYREILNRLVKSFGENLTVQDLPFVQNLALQQTVDFSLILGQAKKNVRISNREVDMAVESIIKQQNFSSKKELDIALKRVGLNLDKFRSMLKDEMLVQKMVAKIRTDVSVTPNDLREIRASHILVTTEAAAAQLLGQLKKGADFAALAKKYSQDPGSAVKGGDLGYFASGNMVEAFDQAAFNLKVGELSGIVKSSFGYHLIKVTDSRLRKFPGQEKDLQKAALQEKQEKAVSQWLSAIKSKAKIEIINPELLADNLRFQGQFFQAAQEYKKAISQNPGNPYLYVFLGDTYATIGQKDLAIAEYEKAINLQAGNPELYLILAKAYENGGQRQAAITQYKKASLVSGDDKAMHEKLRDKFKALKATKEYNQEQAEIKRIEKKAKFVEGLKKQ